MVGLCQIEVPNNPLTNTFPVNSGNEGKPHLHTSMKMMVLGFRLVGAGEITKIEEDWFAESHVKQLVQTRKVFKYLQIGNCGWFPFASSSVLMLRCVTSSFFKYVFVI